MHLKCPLCQAPIPSGDIGQDWLVARCRSCHAIMKYHPGEEIDDQGTTATSEAIRLTCPSCRATIPSQDLDLEELLGQCLACHASVPFPEVFEEEDEDDMDCEPAKRPELEMPSGIRLEDTGHSLVLVWRWVVHRFIIPQTLFWLAASYGIYWLWTSDSAFALGASGDWIIALYGVTALWTLLTYNMLATLINRTVITVDHEELSIWVGPLPWLGSRTLRRDEIKQLYCRRVSEGEYEREPSGGFYVLAKLADDTEVQLLSGVLGRNRALYIEQQIEKYLKIEDLHVPGEVPRDE